MMPRHRTHLARVSDRGLGARDVHGVGGRRARCSSSTRTSAFQRVDSATRASRRMLIGARDGAHGDRADLLAVGQALGRAHESGRHADLSAPRQDPRARCARPMRRRSSRAARRRAARARGARRALRGAAGELTSQRCRTHGAALAFGLEIGDLVRPHVGGARVFEPPASRSVHGARRGRARRFATSRSRRRSPA